MTDEPEQRSDLEAARPPHLAAEAPRHRRLGAFVVLAIGMALVATTLTPDWPRDQNFVFRLPSVASVQTKLEASFVPVGAARAVQGFAIAVDAGRRDVRHESRLPNGDYLVTIELTSTHYSGPNAPVKIATSTVRRVTLKGEETLIVLDGEASE